jgi:hypothetical protein
VLHAQGCRITSGEQSAWPGCGRGGSDSPDLGRRRVVGGVHVHVAVAVKVHDHDNDHQYNYGSGALSSVLIASLGSGTCGGLADLPFGLLAGTGVGSVLVEPFATPEVSL